MKYSYDYNTELQKILNKIYENKIYSIASKNNLSNIDENNINNIIDIFKSSHIYLGSDLDDFIISLMPVGDAGYFFRVEIAKHFNYTYPRLFDYLGNPIKNGTSNKYALKLWQANMEEMFIEDIRNKFDKNNFDTFVESNLSLMAKDIVSYVDNLNNKNKIIIPLLDKSDLISNIKSMILNNELDYSWIETLIDIDKLRSDMEKYAATFDMYNEFDKLEDDLDECIDKFCKYTSEELYNILINENGFIFVDGIGLIKN